MQMLTSDQCVVNTEVREPSVPAKEEFLTAKQVADRLNVAVKTVYGWVRRGLIPYVRIQGCLRFVWSQVVEWLRRHNFMPRTIA